MITVIGQVVTHAGQVSKLDHLGNPRPYTLPANGFRRNQPATIPLHFDHDLSWPIGLVEVLERSRADGLMMVGRIPRDDLADMLVDGPWYLSDSVTCRPTGPLEMGGGRLREISLTRSTANVNTRPVRWSRCDIATDSGSQPNNMPLNWYSCWARAHEQISRQKYRRADHTEIVDLDPLGLVDEVLTDPVAARRRAAPLAPPLSRPKPAPVAAGPSRSRAEAERTAAARGARGYGWTDEMGVQHRVRVVGSVGSFAP